MLLIVGLGNIGQQYQNTRHNVGFLCLDYIASFYNFPAPKENYKSLIAEKNIDSHKVLLQKPLTFMNRSGDAVQPLCSYYKILPDDVIVIQDDIDLDFNVLRYKTESGDGGQKGIRDIQNKIGKNIHRIKIGIGRPSAEKDVSDYVLSNFSKSEMIDLEKTFYEMAIELPHLLKKDFKTFIENINKHKK
ncbi:MAG: aminoacyl-tRNA hydrolase [Alphaproteobacteria bacterium]|jgi:PTH1 family peptidyl-tRNA hydrolase|nr:aminoacyl-tRNA hydrolase [Alphaproteobacteria bacterium]